MPGASGGQERVLDTLELKLQTVESHYMYIGNLTQVLQKMLLTAELSIKLHLKKF